MARGFESVVVLAVFLGGFSTLRGCSALPVTVNEEDPVRPPIVPYTSSDDNSHRLPTAFRPLHYDLSLQPDFYRCADGDCKFNGTVRIWLECMERTDVLTIHSAYSRIDYWLFDETRISNFAFDNGKQFLSGKLPLAAHAEVGRQYEMILGFSGHLQDLTTFGLYKTKYMQNGTERVMAASNFAPTFARTAFPCFDEPAYRATFNITVVYKSTYNVLSNMDPVRESERNGWRTTTFERTPPLPTYLLALVITEYSYVETKTSNGLRIRNWVSHDDLQKAIGSLQMTKAAMTMTEEYLDMRFPLKKLDQVAIPNFVYSGMENMGLVMYSPDILLWEEEVITPPDIANTICHEIAHQWFGDFVTMKWWSDLWMKEGFSQAISWDVCGKAAPGIQQTYFRTFESAWRKDSYELSQPLRYPNPATNPDISLAYDGNILYMKGGIVVRMFGDVFGQRNFRRALRAYLVRNAYSSVGQHDWFTVAQSIQDEFGLRDGTREANMEKFMSSWLWQKGCPLVTVTRTKTGLHLNQERFLLGEQVPDPLVHDAVKNFSSPFGYHWEIPFRFTTNTTVHDANRIVWMHQEAARTDFSTPELPTNAWILANPGFTGYYRVDYDTENWRKLVGQLRLDHEEIPERNRLQLIADSFTLAGQHRQPYSLPLALSYYLRQESELQVWKVFISESQYLRNMLAAKPGRSHLKRYMKNLVSLNYASVSSMQDGSDMDVLMIQLACEYGLEDCERRALQLYKDRHIVNIHPDLESLMYCTTVRLEAAQWESIWNETVQCDWSSLPRIKGLACTTDPEKQKRLLNEVLQRGEVTPNDKVDVLRYALNNHLTRTEVLAIIVRHWENLRKSTSSHWPMARLVRRMQETLNSDLQLQMVRDFLRHEKGTNPDTPAWVLSMMPVLENNLQWMDDDYELVCDALQRINRITSL